ncbi:DNA repair-scaffolding protein isoform X2 [Takifugu flavidus]|uniref:DNA repair-scaffolding protein isoform X2 n=1 Tax=Takifugu flavidus TaxID=433684 RepID=UPI0025443332|nr:DNA repair-scaffolding protein isoform X2 [Takifugu flavidus]
MSFRKRKRRPNDDIKHVLFPDDVENSFQKAGREPLSSVSSARSWQRCGDSFLDPSGLKNPGRKLSALKELVLSPTSGPTAGAAQCDEDIAWSSSDEDQESRLSGAATPGQRRTRAPIHPSRARQGHTSGTDDLPAIDTDSDADDPVGDGEQRISDCDSEPCCEQPEPLKPTNISDYVSDGEDVGRSVTTSSSLASGSSPPRPGESCQRRASDWVRSAQVLLRTPQRPREAQSKTPEDSAKKKRKFQSGGLAERLSRLQSRQRSAVSFWRHQSDASAATVDRPGVLVLEVLEVMEECGMRAARCERHRPPGGAEESAPVLVLFSRETVAHLMPAPKDIIHIYPPWQSLSIEGFSCSIILNTHLSQKVQSAPSTSHPGPPAVERCPPYFLCQTFGRLEASRTREANAAKQVPLLDPLRGFEGSGLSSRLSFSLLEVVEGLGQAGSVGQDVEVVVQRVYATAVPDSSPLSFLKPRVQSGTSFLRPSEEKGKTRLCVLVQDSYGMFSVVQLHLLPCKDDLHHYCHMWQGRTCLLRGIKVVQRVTRERCSRLFSLIDSLWPPVMPLRDHRTPPSTSSETRAAGSAPSFCYLLSGLESSVQPAEGPPLSPLYCPPTMQSLGDILQTDVKSFRCSFAATVIYTRLTQGSDVGQGEVWLVLTDPSLQEEKEEKPERPCRRTAALCVSTSCVLTSSVIRALKSSAACQASFRDVIKEHGVLHCVEQSVIELCSQSSRRPECVAESSAGAGSLSRLLTEPTILPRPVRLDPLVPEVTPNSLCSLTGVIVGVDEDTAYSWPVCNRCGSDNLEILAGGNGSFQCVSCESVVDQPDTRMQLEVFLSSSLNDCTLKVKLQQETIVSILNATALEGADSAGYEVESVLGAEVGPLAVYVRAVTRTPALWMGLEEVSLGGCYAK